MAAAAWMTWRAGNTHTVLSLVHNALSFVRGTDATCIGEERVLRSGVQFAGVGHLGCQQHGVTVVGLGLGLAPPSFTVVSTFISRNIGKAPYLGPRAVA